MVCNCGGSSSSAAGTAAQLSPAPDAASGKTPDGTPVGQDPSKGGTLPAYGTPGGAGTAGANGGYVASTTQHATGLGHTFPPPNGSVDPSVAGLSRKYESNGDYGAFANNPGDKGGPSYGAYQIATAPGSMNNFLNQLQSTDPAAYQALQNAGGAQAAATGDPTFVAAWKDQAANNPQFAADQDGFIQSAYYDPVAAKVQTNLGIDLNSRGLGVQQAMYSWSVQAGAGGASKGLSTALQGRDVSSMSDNDIVNAIYDQRTASVQGSTYSNSITNRLSNERQDALTSNRTIPSTVNTPILTNSQIGV